MNRNLADLPRLSTIRRRLAWLRWWLLGGLLIGVLSAPTFLGIDLPLSPLLAVIALMAAFNFTTQWRVGKDRFGPPELAGQLAVDLMGMGVLLYLTGGASNPLVSLLLLPVAVAALSLPGRWVAGVACLAIGLYSFLMLYSLPLPIADARRATRLHLGGMWLTFVVSSILVAWFMTRMNASLRERDAQLAVVREDALRDAQVVALGQLAAGAAHELGTPLATMGVLTGELRLDTRLPEDVREDIDVLRRQIAACKEILGGLTRKAGIARAGDAAGETVDDWLGGLLARWRTLWPQAECTLELPVGSPCPQIVAPAALDQAVTNLLNNAAQSAASGIRLVGRWTDDAADGGRLVITVHDRGTGFPPEILQRGGSEPLSGQARGSGIGLWLTRAAVERLGGSLHLANTAAGAVATLDLPLTSLQPSAGMETT
jgi:two-component system sensor histidine kinase RegB